MIDLQSFIRYGIVVLVIVMSSTLLIKTSSFSSQDMSERSLLLLTSDNKPTKALYKLLTFFGAPTEDLQEIVDYMQREWFRKPGEERWQQKEQFTEYREFLMALFEDLGLVDAYSPLKKHYHYGIILGGMIDRVRQRIAYCKALYEKGIQIDSLVFFGSRRPLDPVVENKAKLLDFHNPYLPIKSGWKLEGPLPTTEIEMMRMVIQQADLPVSLLEKAVFIDSPMYKNAQGEVRRASTADTIKDWLATNPTPGACLCISNQPFIGYQDSVIRTYLSNEFIIETVGPRATNDITLVTYLDTIARWLYQENIRRRGHEG